MSYMPARYFTLSHEPWDHFLVQIQPEGSTFLVALQGPRGRHSS